MPAAKPRLAEAITVAEIDGEAVLYDSRNGHVHHLRQENAQVVALCDGSATTAELAQALADEQRLAPADADRQVRTSLRDLRKLGLLAQGKRGTATRPGTEEVDLDERGRIRMEVPVTD
jgi:PqqD family protein of HPr-rel-A system